MSIWSDFASVQESNDREYVRPGQFRFEVVEMNTVQSKNPNTPGRTYFAATFKTLTSNQEHTPVGSQRSWVVNLANGRLAMSNIKQFVCALVDADASEVDEATMEKLCSEDQPASGLLVDVEAVEKPTRNGGMFTRLRFSHVSDEEQEQAPFFA